MKGSRGVEKGSKQNWTQTDSFSTEKSPQRDECKKREREKNRLDFDQPKQGGVEIFRPLGERSTF